MPLERNQSGYINNGKPQSIIRMIPHQTHKRVPMANNNEIKDESELRQKLYLQQQNRKNLEEKEMNRLNNLQNLRMQRNSLKNSNNRLSMRMTPPSIFKPLPLSQKQHQQSIPVSKSIQCVKSNLSSLQQQQQQQQQQQRQMEIQKQHQQQRQMEIQKKQQQQQQRQMEIHQYQEQQRYQQQLQLHRQQQMKYRIAQQEMEKPNIDNPNLNISTLTLDINGNSIFAQQNRSSNLNDVVFGKFCQRNKFSIR